LTAGFRLVFGPSLHSPRFSGNQYALRLFGRRKRFMEEKLSREYLLDEFGTDFFSARILIVYFHLVVIWKIFIIPTIESPYSTGDPLFIMPSPMLWQRPFLGCCPVAGEPSEHRIVIWPAEFSLKERADDPSSFKQRRKNLKNSDNPQSFLWCRILIRRTTKGENDNFTTLSLRAADSDDLRAVCIG
jgi:hypothetical protein